MQAIVIRLIIAESRLRPSMRMRHPGPGDVDAGCTSMRVLVHQVGPSKVALPGTTAWGGRAEAAHHGRRARDQDGTAGAG